MPRQSAAPILTFTLIFFLAIPKIMFGQTISVSVSNMPLSEVLQQLSKEHNAKIAFDDDLASKTIVSGSFSNTSLFEVISSILAETSLEAVTISDVIVIRPRLIPNGQSEQQPTAPLPIDYKILGLVMDSGSNEHLPYASIQVKGTSKGITTNSDGYFTLFTNSADTIHLIVSYLGYKATIVRVHPPSQKVPITILLDIHSTLIADAVILQHQTAMLSTESTPGMLRWNSTRNTDMPLLNGLDIAAPLQLLPGIDGTTETLSGLIIRKLPSDKNLFVFDGFTIYHIDHLFGAFTSFNSKSVKDIRVFKGGFDAQWGGRASSVIEITGKSGNANKLSADIGVDLLSFDALIEGPIGQKFTFLLAARRSYTDIFRSKIYYQLLESARSDFDLTTNNYPSFLTISPNEPKISYFDINTKLTFKPSTNDLVSLSLFSAHDAMGIDKQTTRQTLFEDSNWGSSGAGLRWARNWNPQHSNVLTIGASRYDLDFLHSDSTIRRRQLVPINDTISRYALIDNGLSDININLFHSFKANTNSELLLGLQLNWVDLDLKESARRIVNSTSLLDTSRTNSQSMSLSTIWAQHNITYGKIKSLKYGFRANYFGPDSKIYIEPRFQLSVNITSKSYLKLSAGRYYQFVNQILTLSPYSFKRLWTISNGKEFPIVRSNHYTIGGLTRLPKGFSIDLELYSRYTQGITTMQTILRQSESGSRITEEQIMYNLSNNTKGLDLIVLKEFSKSQVWISYSLSESINQSDKINQGNPYFSLYDQLHEVKLAGTGHWKDWGFGFAAIYGSGKPWDEPLFTGNYTLAQDYQKNANRLPDYFRIDFGISYSRTIKSTKIKVGANGFNILNWNNKLAKLYTLSDNPQQTYLQTGTPLIYSDLKGMGAAQMVYFNVSF
jgi:hypothetical protein